MKFKRLNHVVVIFYKLCWVYVTVLVQHCSLPRVGSVRAYSALKTGTAPTSSPQQWTNVFPTQDTYLGTCKLFLRTLLFSIYIFKEQCAGVYVRTLLLRVTAAAFSVLTEKLQTIAYNEIEQHSVQNKLNLDKLYTFQQQ